MTTQESDADRARALAVYADVLRKKAPKGEFIARTVLESPSDAESRIVDAMLAFAALRDRPTDGGVVKITARQRDPITADYGDNFLVAHVSADGKQVGIDHPCDAVWSDVMVAHVALRDYINERIERQDACPFKSKSASPSAPVVETWEGPAYEYGVTWGPEEAHSDRLADAENAIDRVQAILEHHYEGPKSHDQMVAEKIVVALSTPAKPDQTAQGVPQDWKDAVLILTAALADRNEDRFKTVAFVYRHDIIQALSTAPHPERTEDGERA